MLTGMPMTDTLGAQSSGIWLNAAVPTFIVADVGATARREA